MTIMINAPLVDGETQNLLHPETFKIPSLETRQTMRKGGIVKLGFMVDDESIFTVERMWVKITHIDVRTEEYWYQGILQNDPVLLSAQFGDTVQFHARNIIGVH